MRVAGPEQADFPEYEFTFTITKMLFESGQLEVIYKPVDERFTNFTLAIPVPSDFDPSNPRASVELWAPHERWFAQEMILANEQSLLGDHS